MTAHVQRPAGTAGGRTHCACGLPWPCPHSAEGRWAALRDWLETCWRNCRRDAGMVSSPAVADQIDARAEAYDFALAKMRELEGQQ